MLTICSSFDLKFTEDSLVMVYTFLSLFVDIGGTYLGLWDEYGWLDEID